MWTLKKVFNALPQASIERLQEKDRSAIFDFKGLEIICLIAISRRRRAQQTLALARLTGNFCFNRQVGLALYIFGFFMTSINMSVANI
jgi:hypothetical protein